MGGGKILDAPVMRSLPQSIEAEQSVIGSMIIDKNAIAKVLESLNEEDFYKRDDMSIPPLAISLSDFNKLRNMQGYEQINLANYEYTTQWDGNTEDSEIENYINQNKFLI